MPLDGQRGYEEPPRRRESFRRPEPSRYEASHRDYARELAAQMPLDGFPAPCRDDFYSSYANPIRQMGLLGPTVREALPRDEPAAKTRAERNANGSVQEVYSFVKRIGEGGQGHCDLYRCQKDDKLRVIKVMKNDRIAKSPSGNPLEP
ncbi:MAG: hypothetical protein Q9183_004577, partial [Haloplaca sp. 2 TL-2023]